MAVAERVLAIPPDNAYVRAATPTEWLASVELTRREASGWDLHPAFSPGWIGRHRGGFGAVHLHFGFERLSLARLRAWLEELRECGVPLIVTVHDLRNPHLVAQAHHQSQLRLLLAAAERVITLTAGAAAELTWSYGVDADVLAHPGLLQTPIQPASVDDPRTVGVYLKLRAQVVDPDAIVVAVEAAAAGSGARVSVHAPPELSDRLPRTSALAGTGRVDLRTTSYLDDAAFSSYLSGLRVSVLPYRFGTHSGWLEACRDVGTTVVAPDCGYYDQQWDQVVTYSNNERGGLDVGSLTDAVTRALRRPKPAPADPLWRSRQREELRAAHRGIYAALTRRRLVA